MKKDTHKQIRRGVILVFWLFIWQMAAVWTDNRILLTGPLQVLQSLVENAARPDFVVIVFGTFSRIGLGFLAAFLTGLLLGVVSYRRFLVEEILAPVMAVFKAVPVASFVVLLLIWFGSGRLSFWISFLIVFPNVYVNTVAGFRNTDRRLLEMADLYGICGWKRFFYLYRPALMPCLNSCLRISLGMSWKSGVAAEIIGLPEFSLGERLYLSKIYLDTAGLFAWTLTIVLLSFCFEKAVLWLMQRFEAWRPYPVWGIREEKAADRSAAGGAEEIRISHVDKSYKTQQVLCDVTFSMKKGGRYLMTAPSGAGKTTLLRVAAGLEEADRGTVTGMPPHIGMVFQEDRLCEDCDVICNILLGMHSKGGLRMRREQLLDHVRIQAAKILPEECLTEPVRNLSGGMRRRVALLRAVLSGLPVLILDEPFTGLDEENRVRSAEYLLRHQEGRILLVTTHREEDVELLQGVRVTGSGLKKGT